MATSFLQKFARSCVSKDAYYFNDDANRLYPAFGLAKIEQQKKLRIVHESENRARLSKSLHQLANLTAQPEKEADWAIMGGLAQGIGGVGAGIAAAAQTQVNNMAVRARNAKRAADAQTMHNAADNLDSILGDIRRDTTISSDDIGHISVRLCNTEELFNKLGFHCSFPEPLISESKHVAPISFPTQDHNTDNQIVSISVSTSHSVRIDGYVAVEMMDSARHSFWEKVIPLPMLGAGRPEETSTLIISIPKAVQELRFHPIALWELTDAGEKNAYSASTIESIPNSKGFQETWQSNLAASNSRNEAFMAKRKKGNRYVIIIGGIIIAAMILAFFLAITNLNNNSNFDLGCISSFGSPAEANREYFSKLPKSYHERVAEEYLDNARLSLDGSYALWENAVEFLSYASRYARTDAQRSEIRLLYVKAYISSNEEGLAEEYISKQYNAGTLTPDEVVEYAKQMYDYQPRYSDENNRMQADALKLVNMVKDQNAQALQLSIEWDEINKAYSAALESFKARDYDASLAFFVDRTDMEYGWEYYGFSKAATDLFGTWKDSEGNQLMIAQDPNKELEYWTLFNPSNPKNPEPYKMPLSITYNGKDISYCEDKFWTKKTQQCTLRLNVYESSGSVTYDMHYIDVIVGNPYSFDYNADKKSLTVTHRSEARKSNGRFDSDVLWTRTFTRID